MVPKFKELDESFFLESDNNNNEDEKTKVEKKVNF